MMIRKVAQVVISMCMNIDNLMALLGKRNNQQIRFLCRMKKAMKTVRMMKMIGKVERVEAVIAVPQVKHRQWLREKQL